MPNWVFLRLPFHKRAYQWGPHLGTASVSRQSWFGMWHASLEGTPVTLVAIRLPKKQPPNLGAYQPQASVLGWGDCHMLHPETQPEGAAPVWATSGPRSGGQEFRG